MSLFIPLKAEYYHAFAAGRKTTEYRLWGPRWNRRTIWRGQPVRLSYGYGTSRPRLHGVVTWVRRVRNTVTSIYPAGAWLVAITIKMERSTP